MTKNITNDHCLFCEHDNVKDGGYSYTVNKKEIDLCIKHERELFHEMCEQAYTEKLIDRELVEKTIKKEAENNLMKHFNIVPGRTLIQIFKTKKEMLKAGRKLTEEFDKAYVKAKKKEKQ